MNLVRRHGRTKDGAKAWLDEQLPICWINSAVRSRVRNITGRAM